MRSSRNQSFLRAWPRVTRRRLSMASKSSTIRCCTTLRTNPRRHLTKKLTFPCRVISAVWVILTSLAWSPPELVPACSSQTLTLKTSSDSAFSSSYHTQHILTPYLYYITNILTCHYLYIITGTPNSTVTHGFHSSPRARNRLGCIDRSFGGGNQAEQ